MAQPATAHPFLHGEFAPVREETTAFDLRVTGEIPPELCGRFLRNGPNPIAAVNEATHHWFLGNGMVHGIRLREGRAEWYRNRYVRTPDVTDVLGEPRCPNPWPPGHGVFSANTHVMVHAGRTLALVEGGSPPVELSFDLDTVSVADFGGTLPGPFSAHPKRDPLTGELHAMGYFWGWGNRVQYLVVGTDGRVRRTVDIPLPGAPMIHDMAITERYALVFDQPCLLNHAAAVAGAPLPYRWDPDYTPRIGLLPREGGAEDIVWIETASCYVFHPMNAFDDADGCVQVDVVRHPRMFATEQRGPMEGRPVLERWTLDPARRGFRATRMDERPVEFPRIDERLTGLPYRYGYASMPGRGFAQRAIVRYDMQSGASELRDEGEGKGFGEPVFVPRHASAAEDDGWVMALRLDRAADRSDLVILDAADIAGEPVATVHLPVRVPAGFHGSWCADG